MLFSYAAGDFYYLIESDVVDSVLIVVEFVGCAVVYVGKTRKNRSRLC